MAIEPENQVTKSWVHEPGKLAASNVDAIKGFFIKYQDAAGLVGGIALTIFGRKLRGASGNALAALGTTMAFGAGTRLVYRVGPSNIRAWIMEKLPPVTATTTEPTAGYPG